MYCGYQALPVLFIVHLTFTNLEESIHSFIWQISSAFWVSSIVLDAGDTMLKTFQSCIHVLEQSVNYGTFFLSLRGSVVGRESTCSSLCSLVISITPSLPSLLSLRARESEHSLQP
jgi:hypothetical protein